MGSYGICRMGEITKQKRFFVFSITILNLFYFLLLISGVGKFISVKDYVLFLFLALGGYVAESFGVIRFGKFTVSSQFFFLFPMMAVFGPIVTSIVAYLIAIFDFSRVKPSIRMYSAVQYAISYYVAGLAFQIAGAGWAGIIIALLIFKILNFIMVDLFMYFNLDRWKNMVQSLKYMAFETGVFAIIMPMIFVLIKNINDLSLEVFTVYTLVFPFFFTYMLSRENRAKEELVEEKSSLSKNVGELKRILEISEMLKSNIPVVDLMMRVASIIHDDLGWEYILVSLVHPDDTIERIAYAGISQEDFARLKKNPPTLSFVKNIMRDEFKISNSYFIPQEANVNIPNEMSYIGKYEGSDRESWQDKDLLWIPIREKNGRMIAYVSPDKPRNGMRPKIDDIIILEIFANQVLVALENSSEFEVLQEKAIRDTQTGLYNHTEFYNRIEKVVESGEPFSLLMMDIDDFKLVNDSYGHQMGDIIIDYISEKIKSSIRHGDIAARYGGDEFTIILRGTKKQLAKSIAERLRMSVISGNPPIKITLSIGIAEYPEDSASSNGLVSSADRALYMAKMRGKNQIATFSG